MRIIEADPLPAVCERCLEPECDVCDHGLERWIIIKTEDQVVGPQNVTK